MGMKRAREDNFLSKSLVILHFAIRFSSGFFEMMRPAKNKFAVVLPLEYTILYGDGYNPYKYKKYNPYKFSIWEVSIVQEQERDSENSSDFKVIKCDYEFRFTCFSRTQWTVLPPGWSRSNFFNDCKEFWKALLLFYHWKKHGIIYLYFCARCQNVSVGFRAFSNFSESIGPISKMFVPFYSSFQGLSIAQISFSQKISTLNFVTYTQGTTSTTKTIMGTNELNFL